MSKVNCPRVKCKNPAIIDKQYGVLPCLDCRRKDEQTQVRMSPEFYTLSQQDRFTTQRDHHAKDILQPFIGDRPNPEFVRAYPERRNDYYTPEQLKSI